MRASAQGKFRLAKRAFALALVMLLVGAALMIAGGLKLNGTWRRGHDGELTRGGLIPDQWRFNGIGGIWRYSPGQFNDPKRGLTELQIDVRYDRTRIVGIYVWNQFTVSLNEVLARSSDGTDLTKQELMAKAAEIYGRYARVSGLADSPGLFELAMKSQGATVKVFYWRLVVALALFASPWLFWSGLVLLPVSGLAAAVIKRRQLGRLCLRCGYDRAGLTAADKCPECGETVETGVGRAAE